MTTPRDRLRTEVERTLAELRRIRDLVAKQGEPGEAERINARIVALKEALA